MTDETVPKKAAKPSKTDALKAEIENLTLRVEKLERIQQVLVDGYEFAANEARPLYGMGAIAQIFDAIAVKAKELLK